MSAGGVASGGASTGGSATAASGSSMVIGGTSFGGGPAAAGGLGGAPGQGGATGLGGTAGLGGAAGGGGQAAGGGAAVDPELVGWATQNGSTTGGGDATPIPVSTFEALQAAASGTQPAVIHVQGVLQGRLQVGSNKTIIGMSGATIVGPTNALVIENSKNVIIKNIKLTGKPTGKHPNTLVKTSENVWLDHIHFEDGMSDLLRFQDGADFATVSWSKFSHTVFGHEHMAVNIGLTDNEPLSAGKMNVTLHHNYFADKINERAPRGRFGKIHSFNNYIPAKVNASGSMGYAAAAGYDANVRSERNVYEGFIGNHWAGGCCSLVFRMEYASPASILQSIEDEFVNCNPDGIALTRGTAFTPPYAYTAEPTAGLKEKVVAGAGPK